MRDPYRLIALTLPGSLHAAIAIGASRAGALGVVDLEYVHDLEAARAALDALVRFGKGERGVKLDLASAPFAASLLESLPPEIGTVILARPEASSLAGRIETLRGGGRRVLVEATDFDAASAAGGVGNRANTRASASATRSRTDASTSATRR